MNNALTPANIRLSIRRTRRELTSAQQQQAAESTYLKLSQHPKIINAKHIALFLSIDGELDTTPLINGLWQQGKTVYLPVIHPFCPGHLLFICYQPDSILISTPLGVQQPKLDVNRVLPLAQLDIMFVPLVAFDAQGNRLGMGGGYYDRTLQNWKQYHFWPIGLAHDCQQVKQLPNRAWDVPLPEIITPSKTWIFT